MNLNEIKSFLARLVNILGLPVNTIPVEKEAVLNLVKDFRNFFGEYKPDDMIEALHLAFNGNINQDMNLYGRGLNMPFIATLMNKYKNYKSLFNIRKNKNHNESYPGQSLAQQIENKQNSILEIQQAFERYKTKGIEPRPLVPMVYVNTLKAIGLLQDTEIDKSLYQQALANILKKPNISGGEKLEIQKLGTSHYRVITEALRMHKQTQIISVFNHAIDNHININLLLEQLKTKLNGKNN